MKKRKETSCIFSLTRVYFWWGCSALCCFCRTWGDAAGFFLASADVPNSSRFSTGQMFLHFWSWSHFFLFIANRVFRAEETLRSVEPCQLLSKPLRQELKTTVKPQQAPVEQADTLVEVDVRSSFIVQVCIQPNRDWTWKAHSKAWLLFFLPRWNPHRSSASIKDNNPKQTIVRVERAKEERHKQGSDVEAELLFV